MNRIRGPFSGGPSKATPQTLCQKCLKRDNYECKTTTQERPYAARPSRTQQLLNPKLVPKLTSDVPNDLLRKKGLADEQLAKKREERSRKRAVDENDALNGSRKRSRSLSSYSSTSVSTISTNLSRSASPKRPKVYDNGHYRLSRTKTPPLSLQEKTNHKRRRSPTSSAASYSSESSYERRRPRQQENDRNTRRRRSSISPDIRGRGMDYNSRRGSGRRRSRRRSRSSSVDRSQVARHRHSMTPGIRTNHDRDGGHPNHRNSLRENERRYSNDNDRYGSSFRDHGRGTRHEPAQRNAPPTPQVRKERSLSPFSKRLALTQAMNMGR